MPLTMQVKLLRVLEERRVERVGGSENISVDCRIVCATHRDLRREVAAGRFREDLWYRLAVMPLDVPPLAERAADLPALIEHLQRHVPTRLDFTSSALAALMAYDWPGNVRELRNLILRASILYQGRAIDAGMAAALIGAAPPRAAVPDPVHSAANEATEMVAQTLDLKSMLTELERRHIVAALGAAHGVVADAARLVGMGRTTFLEKMKRHEITRAVAG
jgi:sigma-54 dependent transcriptional regulator, flagellar regulatory protein